MSMDIVEKKNLLDTVDARTRLAGSNKMEILLFSLGTRETLGINVFKVREVGRTPHITKTPNMPRGVEGLVSLRGNVIPVLSLVSFLEHKDEPIERGKHFGYLRFHRSGRTRFRMVRSQQKRLPERKIQLLLQLVIRRQGKTKQSVGACRADDNDGLG